MTRRIFVPMNKLLGIVFASIIISVSMMFLSYAQEADLGEQITLTAFMNLTWNGTETVSFYIDTKAYEVDTDVFSELSDSIMLTDIQDRVFNSTSETGIFSGILFITIFKEDEMMSFAAISPLGEVDRYGMFMSRLPCAAFEMETADLQKLYGLLPEEVQDKVQDLSVSSKTDLEETTETEKSPNKQDFLAENKGYIIVSLITVSVLSVIVIVLKLVLFKRKK